MLKIEGKSLSQGAVIGKVRFYRETQYDIDEGDYEDSDAEIEKFERAMEAVKEHKWALANAAEVNSDIEGSLVFASHVALLEDKGLIHRVEEYIRAMKKKCRILCQDRL